MFFRKPHFLKYVFVIITSFSLGSPLSLNYHQQGTPTIFIGIVEKIDPFVRIDDYEMPGRDLWARVTAVKRGNISCPIVQVFVLAENNNIPRIDGKIRAGSLIEVNGSYFEEFWGPMSEKVCRISLESRDHYVVLADNILPTLTPTSTRAPTQTQTSVLTNTPQPLLAATLGQIVDLKLIVKSRYIEWVMVDYSVGEVVESANERNWYRALFPDAKRRDGGEYTEITLQNLANPIRVGVFGEISTGFLFWKKVYRFKIRTNCKVETGFPVFQFRNPSPCIGSSVIPNAGELLEVTIGIGVDTNTDQALTVVEKVELKGCNFILDPAAALDCCDSIKKDFWGSAILLLFSDIVCH